MNSISQKITLAQAFLYVLLLAHLGWLIVHLSLSAQGIINQWKLGGYGMYTGPSPKTQLEIFALEDKLTTSTVSYRQNITDSTYSYPYYLANYKFNIYCLETSTEKINLLLEYNEKLVGQDILLKVYGRFMEVNPVRTTYQTISETEIIWTDNRNYTYTANVPFCKGKQYTGTGSFELH